MVLVNMLQLEESFKAFNIKIQIIKDKLEG